MNKKSSHLYTSKSKIDKFLSDFLTRDAVPATEQDDIVNCEYQLDSIVSSQYSVCPHCHKPFQGKTTYLNHIESCPGKRKEEKSQRKAPIAPVNLLI